MLKAPKDLPSELLVSKVSVFKVLMLLSFSRLIQIDIILPLLPPQTAIFGMINEANNIYNLNYILLGFKYYVYRSRENHVLHIDILIDNLIEIKKKEKRISFVSNNKTEAYNKNGAVMRL